MEKPWLRFYEKGVPHELELPNLTLSQLFNTAVKNNPRGVAMSFLGARISYRKLHHLVHQLAVALTRLGVKKGDRVAIILPNIPQYPMAHFAALEIGAILVPTNPMYVERELKHQLNDSGARTVIVLDILFPKLDNILHETEVKNVIITSMHEYLPGHLKLLYPIKARKEDRWIKIKPRPGIHFFRELMTEKFCSELPDAAVTADDIAILLYTGGTTGLSKGAILTHKNLVSNVTQVRRWYSAIQESQEVILCALPFFHSYGLTTGLHLSVKLCSTMVLIPNPRDIKAILVAIKKNRATLFSGVPTLYIAVNNFPNIAKYDIASIKACVSGGAPLPLEVAKQFESITGGRLVEGYGLSETSPVTHVNPIMGNRKEGSIGIPVANTEAKIVDPETKEELPMGEVGELVVKGPQVMKGYWNMEKETNAVIKDGWLFTGDMAKMDEDGFFYIVDRKKDLIIAGGFNIFPREIEEVLFEHPKILEAAVIGVPDEYRGETVKAVIVVKEGESLTAEEVILYCKDKLASFKVPKMVEFCDSLPKSNIGKVLKRVLIEQSKI